MPSKFPNRIREIQNGLIGTEFAEDIMDDLATALADSQTQMPIPGKVYVYSYYAAKADLLTDRFPIVEVTGVYQWGWSGNNLHIGEPRNYNWDRKPTPFYLIHPREVQSALTLPLMRLYQN